MSMVPIIRLHGKPLHEREQEIRKRLLELDHADCYSQPNVAIERANLQALLHECWRTQREQLAKLVVAMADAMNRKQSPRVIAADAMQSLQDLVGVEAVQRLMPEAPEAITRKGRGA